MYQDRKKLFYDGGWQSKNVGQKIKKKRHWLKRLNAVPKKRNLDQNVNDAKCNIWNSFFFFFKNIISGIQLFIFVHKLRWISSEFFLISDFLAESLKASQESSWLYKFSKKRVSVSCQEICTAPFLDAQELYSRSTLKANVHILLYISVRKFLFQRRS